MNTCSQYKETLALDVHGELAPEERIDFERHLADCEDCRHKREILCALIRTAKEACSVPALTAEEEQLLSGRVQRSLRAAQPKARPARMGWWLAPALASCMVLLVAGWFGLKNVGPDTAAITTQHVPAEVVSTTKERLEKAGPDIAAITTQRVPDEEVISKNKELLEDPGTDTAANTTKRTPEEIIRANKELLENMDLLQDMESLEQLVNLLDKQNHETSLRERGNNADPFRAHV